MWRIAAKADEVALNKSVEVYFPEDDDADLPYRDDHPGQSPKGYLISIDSPLGKMALHHKEGDRVHVAVNENTGYSVVIKKVGKAEDDAQDVIKGF